MKLTIIRLKSQIVGMLLLLPFLSGFANSADPSTDTLQKGEEFQIQLPKIRVDQANRSFVTGPRKILVLFGVTYFHPVLDGNFTPFNSSKYRLEEIGKLNVRLG